MIDLKPTDKEYNNFSARKRIEQYKDRLGKDLYECKINQKKKEENDKELEKLKEKKHKMILKNVLKKNIIFNLM